MSTVFYVAQGILALVLIGLVLLQSKNTGAGAMFGGDTSFRTTRRGFEKTLFNLTVIVAVVFFALTLATVMIG